MARWALLGGCVLFNGGLTAWVLTSVGGFGRNGSALFNWHPLTMSVAMVVLTLGVAQWSGESKGEEK